MTVKSTPPSITETAFDCPHCGAFTSQHWFTLSCSYIDKEPKIPTIPDEEMKKRLQEAPLEAERKASLIKWAEKMESGLIFLESIEQGKYVYNSVCNLFLSKCFNSSKFAVWVHDQLVHPTAIAAPLPNPDLPPDVLRDYEEAGRIVGESPRGAAALLRLAIQKLCLELGEKGERIDDDIASLVKK